MTNREVFYQELCTVGSFLEHVFRHGNVGQRGSREDYLDRKPETTYICGKLYYGWTTDGNEAW